jgi:hypothetical protein
MTSNLRNNIGLLMLALFLGAILGWAANFVWYLIHALIFGWGDTAPEWYVCIQDKVQMGIFVLSLVFCIVLIYFRSRKTMKNAEINKES